MPAESIAISEEPLNAVAESFPLAATTNSVHPPDGDSRGHASVNGPRAHACAWENREGTEDGAIATAGAGFGAGRPLASVCGRMRARCADCVGTRNEAHFHVRILLDAPRVATHVSHEALAVTETSETEKAQDVVTSYRGGGFLSLESGPAFVHDLRTLRASAAAARTLRRSNATKGRVASHRTWASGTRLTMRYTLAPHA